jgi:hypothetical protein
MDHVGIDGHQKHSQLCEMVAGKVVSRRFGDSTRQARSTRKAEKAFSSTSGGGSGGVRE